MYRHPRMRLLDALIWIVPLFAVAVRVASAAPAAAAAPPPAGLGTRPNVIIIMTDDQGLGDFSFTGNPILRTPNLDALARSSIRLTDFHVTPMCSPTRGQLLTGLSALRNGATSVTAGRTFLRPGLPTLSEVFGRAGYKTGIFGKWHLGDHYPHRPMDRGFQECVYHLGWGLLHSTPEFDWPLFDGRYFHNGVEKRFRGHCTDLWFDTAMAWMAARKAAGEPFLCYIPTNAPHSPHIDLESDVAPYQGKGPAAFFGMIAHIDRRVGDLEKFLTEQKLRDDTIVLFMTDNGGTAGVKVYNAGLRGRKTEYYDGGHRVPCWIRWPNGGLGQPRDIGMPTQNTDLLPTLCELAGVAPPTREAADEPYAGISIAGLLRGKQAELPDRKLVVQYGQILKKFDCCVIWGRWRLVKGTELYDIEVDRAQTTNLADRHPEVVAAMRQYYEGWWAGLEPTLNDFVPISIGADAQPVVEMTSGDWEGIYADNTGFVREAVGGPTGGHWHIRVETAGEYQFVLRRWPEQTGAALGDKYEPSAKSPANKAKVNTRGFPSIARAVVTAAGQTAEVTADPKAGSATLTLRLPAGKTILKAWFADAQGDPLCGAFFVTISKSPQAAPDAGGKQPRAARPNIVFVLCDDLRWDTYGAAGHPHLKTPHIDRLAREGVTFRNAFCTTSLCSPSRASILTGLYAHAHGVRDNFTELPPELPSFPAQLQRAGYQTAYLGKWHMGENNDGRRPGFDHFVTHKGQGKYFDTEFCFNGGERRVVPGYYTTVVTDMAVDWLKQPRTQPFLMMVGHKAPHSFYVPEPRYAHAFDGVTVGYPASAYALGNKPDWIKTRMETWHGIYGPLFDFRKTFPDSRPEAVRDFAAMIRAYWATVLSIDDSVGRLYAALREAGQLDNTIFVFTADNGLLNGEHGMVDKRTMHDPSIRVPLIVRYPPMLPANEPRVIDQMVLHQDLAPSLLDLCGAEPLPRCHGQSWRNLIKGESAGWRTSWYYEYNYERQFPYTPNVRGIRTDRWKYIRYPHGDGSPDRHRAELYDLAADPGELHNLIDEPQHAEQLRILQAELSRLMKTFGPAHDTMPLDEGIKKELPDLKIR